MANNVIKQLDKFEYKREMFNGVGVSQIIYELNKLGDDGWELISVVPEPSPFGGASRLIYFFKRNKTEVIL